MRMISEACELWLGSSSNDVVGSLRCRGGRADTKDNTPLVNCEGVSFP